LTLAQWRKSASLLRPGVAVLWSLCEMRGRPAGNRPDRLPVRLHLAVQACTGRCRIVVPLTRTHMSPMNRFPLRPGLFGGGPQTLADDEFGRITYQPHFLDSEFAVRAFDALLRDVPWHSERRRMYLRDVLTPRLLASYALDEPLPDVIAELVPRVAAAAGTRFTHVGLNQYRDERDSVAQHNDHLHELSPGQPIALVSLGATREMLIRAKPPRRGVLRLDLEAGSLLTMSYATQLHYDHGIPKQRTPMGPRISLAFRVRAAGGIRHHY
jgi:alkylated DNA repair dioxygenase AlkB